MRKEIQSLSMQTFFSPWFSNSKKVNFVIIRKRQFAQKCLIDKYNTAMTTLLKSLHYMKNFNSKFKIVYTIMFYKNNSPEIIPTDTWIAVLTTCWKIVGTKSETSRLNVWKFFQIPFKILLLRNFFYGFLFPESAQDAETSRCQRVSGLSITNTQGNQGSLVIK